MKKHQVNVTLLKCFHALISDVLKVVLERLLFDCLHQLIQSPAAASENLKPRGQEKEKSKVLRTGCFLVVCLVQRCVQEQQEGREASVCPVVLPSAAWTILEWLWSSRCVAATCVTPVSACSSVRVKESRNTAKSLVPPSHDLFCLACSSASDVAMETRCFQKAEFLEVGPLRGGARTAVVHLSYRGAKTTKV